MQISLFDGENRFKITKPIRLIELFAGIGAQAKALKNIGANFEHYRICEFDRFAVQSYNAIHGTDFKTSDITKITAEDLAITDTDNYCYIMTYSFPCQDLSLAGKRMGMSKGTRSGLLWEVERLLKETKELPQVLLMENVPPVLKAEGWAEWISFLDGLGYKSRYEVLNAKDFGIPQNRARVFMVSILGDYFYTFPQKQKFRKRLRDMLEPEPVDKKFYLTDAQIKATLNSTFQQTANKIQDEGGGMSEIKLKQVATMKGGVWDKIHESARRVYDPEGLAPTIHTCGGGNLEPKIVAVRGCEVNILTPKRTEYGKRVRKQYESGQLTEKRKNMQRLEKRKDGLTNTIITVQKDNYLLLTYDEQNKKLRVDGTIGTLTTDGSSPKHNNRVIIGSLQKNAAKNFDGICPTLTEAMGMGGGQVPIHNYGCLIRKLTPRECFRLMAFTDTDFDEVKAVGMSDSQCYKQAGNSIVVTVLEAIFKEMIGDFANVIGFGKEKDYRRRDEECYKNT